MRMRCKPFLVQLQEQPPQQQQILQWQPQQGLPQQQASRQQASINNLAASSATPSPVAHAPSVAFGERSHSLATPAKSAQRCASSFP